jgi:hypothetical protein
MTTLETIASQVVIALVVVVLYHLWSSRTKQPAQKNLNLNPDLNLNLHPPSISLPSLAAPPASPPPPAPARAAAVPVPAAVPVATPPEIVAVIAAAITVVLGPHRVLAIQQTAAPAPEVNVWALEGRLKQFMSHKVR